MTVILDGKTLSVRLLEWLKSRLEEGRAFGLPQPSFVAVQVGDDLPSTVYIRAKKKACEELGFIFHHLQLPAHITMVELRQEVEAINSNPEVHGLIVQSPLPSHLEEIEVQRMVSPVKDVDCFHPENVGLLYIGKPRFMPCTAAGIVELLMAYGIDPSGKRVVILGRSVIVGRPLALILMLKWQGGDATVTVAHSRSPNLPEICRQADILIPAVGRAELVRGDWVKDGAVVVDVGINRLPDPTQKRGYRLVGDVAFDEVSARAFAIAPVPGGVGPMTVAILMANVMRAAGYDLPLWLNTLATPLIDQPVIPHQEQFY
ncbi:MAG: bifunctional 5,10-methylenetetrahydrofolate dehydrogenase/5,10-methenyltetrahydrofolate cyclohydrolase [bacterium]